MSEFKKIKDRIVFFDEHNNAFPCAVKTDNGKILVFFRRSEVFDDGTHRHHTCNDAQILYIESNNGGKTFDRNARPICGGDEHGGAGIPCVIKLSDGTIVLSVWFTLTEPQNTAKKKLTAMNRTLADIRTSSEDKVTYVEGLYTYRSTDNGETWEGPYLVACANLWAGGPAAELPDGRILLPCYGKMKGSRSFGLYFFISNDGGKSWSFYSRLNTNSMSGAPSDPALFFDDDGKINVVFRTIEAEFGVFVSRSSDFGKTWGNLINYNLELRTPNYFPLRLKSKKILLIYGKRNYNATPEKPRGIYAQLLDGYLNGISHENEFCLRDDAPKWDSSYVWALQEDNGDILAFYYYHCDRLGNIRYIGSTRFKETEI